MEIMCYRYSIDYSNTRIPEMIKYKLYDKNKNYMIHITTSHTKSEITYLIQDYNIFICIHNIQAYNRYTYELYCRKLNNFKKFYIHYYSANVYNFLFYKYICDKFYTSKNHSYEYITKINDIKKYNNMNLYKTYIFI